MTKDLVSIITPCYNMEKYISRLMDSVIKQTYRPIEFVLVDDGSTDQSYRIAEAYKAKFKQAGIDYILIHQENNGLGGAINAGLQFVTGEYLCWPDADDYLEPTAGEDRVKAFLEHPDCAVVTSNAYVRQSSNLQEVTLLVDGDIRKHIDPWQFLYHLNEESIFCPGCHMAKSSMFFKVNPDGSIYPARRGQNWQMLLPLYYKYKRYFLNKPLYNYVIYEDSMSRGDSNYEKSRYRFEEHEEIIKKVLKKIEDVQKVDMKEYFKFIDEKYAKLRMSLAIKYSKPDVFVQEYRKKKATIGLDIQDFLGYMKFKIPFLKVVIDVLYRIVGRLIFFRKLKEMKQIFEREHR